MAPKRHRMAVVVVVEVVAAAARAVILDLRHAAATIGEGQTFSRLRPENEVTKQREPECEGSGT